MTSDSPSQQRLEAVVAELNEDAAAGLTRLIETNPALLEALLADLGYLDDAETEIVGNEEATTLTEPQSRLHEIVQEMGNPRSAAEIVGLIDSEYPSFTEQHQSAKHRSWVSTQLNELVEAGEIGRFKEKRTVRYTITPVEAIRHWALHNNQFVDDVQTEDATQIAEDTGMPIRVVLQALDTLLNDD